MSVDVTTRAQVEQLAERILSAREHPLVLVSTDENEQFRFDVDRLRRDLAEVADVVTISTGTATRHLESLLPPKTHVFGGAARSYGPDFFANPDWMASHLRFPGHTDTGALVDDAMAQLGRRTVETVSVSTPKRAHGVVEGLVAGGTRAMVRLDDGTLVTATGDLLPPELSLADAVVTGARIEGILNGTRLQLEPAEPDLSGFPDGSHTLALVTKVTELRATLQLHPRVSVVLRRRDVSADEGPVNEILSAGDVVRVLVRQTQGKDVALSFVDADPNAPLVPAMALVVGGSPWLEEGREPAASAVPGTISDAATRLPEAATSDVIASSAAQRIEIDGLATRDDISVLSREIATLRGDMLALTNLVARTAGGASGPDSITAQLREENELLRARLADERAERAQLELRLSSLSQKHRDTNRALRDADRGSSRPRGEAATEASLRDEITRIWTERTAQGDRARWPLREYRFGPSFVASFNELDDGQQGKALRASVDAITGRDREIAGRDVHRLRTGPGGEDAYRQRADGARAWRSAIEQNTPGARRLHYWELTDQTIELSRVGHHDDLRP